MSNMIVHYQGFQIEIYENHPTWIDQRYASEVSLSSHPDFYIFDGNGKAPNDDMETLCKFVDELIELANKKTSFI